MNRRSRRAVATQRKARSPGPTFSKSLWGGTKWWWGPVAGVAAVKDAWEPFAKLLLFMTANSWIFPIGWVVTIGAHWLIVDNELDQQRHRLAAIRKQAKSKR